MTDLEVACQRVVQAAADCCEALAILRYALGGLQKDNDRES